MGEGAGGGSVFHILSFLSFCLCRRRSRRVHPDAVPVEEEGFLGGSAQLYGDAVADDLSTLRVTGEYLSADTLSLGNCTLGSLGACSLSVVTPSALDLPRAKVGVPYTDFKYLIGQYIFSTWQDDWNGAVMNKLHPVKPVLLQAVQEG